jgi:dihydrolipoamide dehydrogenase
MQCGDQHIFIAGDADNERPVLEAADQGRIAGDNAGAIPTCARPAPHAADDRLHRAADRHAGRELPRAVRVDAGRFAIGKVSFENQGRSRVMLQNKGMLRVYGEYAAAASWAPR